MKVRVKKTREVIEVYPKGNGKELRFVDFETKKDYSWDDLESVRTIQDKKVKRVSTGLKVGISAEVRVVEQTQFNQKVSVK